MCLHEVLEEKWKKGLKLEKEVKKWLEELRIISGSSYSVDDVTFYFDVLQYVKSVKASWLEAENRALGVEDATCFSCQADSVLEIYMLEQRILELKNELAKVRG